MIQIFEARDPIEAAIVKGLLELYGIQVSVRGSALYGGIGELPVTGLITLWVAEEDAPRARELLRSHRFS